MQTGDAQQKLKDQQPTMHTRAVEICGVYDNQLMAINQ